jgi:hypothetical protein
MASTTAAVALARKQPRAHSPLRRIATILFVAEIAVAVALVVVLAVIGTADAAGLDFLVPGPGPIPAPSVAPPGLGL